MKPDIKAKWIAALRSGEYTQVSRRLRSVDGKRHCCLGVLCDVMGKKDGWEEDSQSISNDELIEAGVYLAEHAKDNARNPAMALATMNDRGDSFAEIADYIEANL